MSTRAIDQNILRYLEEDRTHVEKRGKPHPKWDDKMLEYTLSMVEEHPEVCKTDGRGLTIGFVGNIGANEPTFESPL